MRLTENLVLAPSEQEPGPEVKAHLFRADRGNRKGLFLLAWNGPLEVAGKPPQASRYRLLSPAKVVSLPDVDVLGIHYLKVRPDRREAFERYVDETLHPAVGNLRPDLRLLYYKAVEGPAAGNYILIFALTKTSRDKYWPGGSDSDDLRAAFKPVQQFSKELNTYLVEGSALTDPKFAAAVFESREWTDFVLLPR